jgi:hypothetical protein
MKINGRAILVESSCRIRRRESIKNRDLCRNEKMLKASSPSALMLLAAFRAGLAYLNFTL